LESAVTTLVTSVAFVALLVAFAFACLRLLRGPTLADRIVAIDMLVVLAIGFIAVFAARTGQTAVLDAAAVLALIGFLGTVALARYLEGGSPPGRE
jgi:multicomponent Na+:H+ antiporter subunit F